MKVTKSIIKVICDLEHIIGEQCYNPNSYDGWTGESGCSFRYPVYFFQEKGDDTPVKVHHNINGRSSNDHFN